MQHHLERKKVLLAFTFGLNQRFDIMKKSSFKKLMAIRKERNPCCTLCRNHDVHTNTKGHKHHCPFKNCDCVPCIKGRQKRVVMSKQVRLRRKQMKGIEGRSNYSTPVKPGRVDFSLAAVKAESPLTNDHRSLQDEKELAVVKHSGGNVGLIQSVSNIQLHSQLSVHRQQSFNCSAYMPTPSFQLQWNPRDVFSGFHSYNSYSNWRPEQPVSSCPIEPPTSTGFTVSDNSAFVKYCGYSPRESNSCRFGHSSSTEAATLLASFGS